MKGLPFSCLVCAPLSTGCPSFKSFPCVRGVIQSKEHTLAHLRTPPCSDELNRPENASLKDIVGKLKKAKAAIDAGGIPLA